MNDKKYLIVGLGNAEQQYAGTRHNYGFEVVNAVAQNLGATFKVDRIKEIELETRHDVVAFTRAVSESLVPRAMHAVRELGYGKLVVAGGVAANSRIRKDFQQAAEAEGVTLFIPPLRLCGDNAAMIGAQGYYEYLYPGWERSERLRGNGPFAELSEGKQWMISCADTGTGSGNAI